MNQRKISAISLFVFALAVIGSAQTSNVPTITLNATVQESLTVTLSGNLLTWSNLDPTAALALNPPDGGTTILATTTWTLRPGRTQLRLYAFFASPVALASVTGGPGAVDIPASAFEVSSTSVFNSNVLTPVTQAVAGVPVPGASLILNEEMITGTNRNGTWSDTLSFNINMSSAAMQQLPADDYVGTLSIMAEATP
jgi:hypothetical protein